MINKQEILDFFQRFPKQNRNKHLEQVLLYAIAKLKKKFGEAPTEKDLQNLNRKFDAEASEEQTPRFKDPTSTDSKNIKAFPSSSTKENDRVFTHFPLKVENRRTMSSDMNQFILNSSRSSAARNKKPLAAKSQNEKDVLKLADDFLKNPFASSMHQSKMTLNTQNKYFNYS